MEYMFHDDMKKEGRPFKMTMMGGYVLTILSPLSVLLSSYINYTKKEVLIITLAYFLIGTFGLYGWLYSKTYEVKFNREEIVVKSLLKRTDIQIKEITQYTCQRYRKSVFYQFSILTNGKKIVVNTRHVNELKDMIDSQIQPNER